MMKPTEEERAHPAFPYCLSSYGDVNIYPLDEFWNEDKPFLYIGAGDDANGEGFEVIIYDISKREEITIKPNSEDFSFWHVEIEGKKVSLSSEWPQNYINSLAKYQFTTSNTARNHGHNYKLPVHLVLKFNEEWGLFRMSMSNFRSIYLPELTEVLELNL